MSLKVPKYLFSWANGKISFNEPSVFVALMFCCIRVQIKSEKAIITANQNSDFSLHFDFWTFNYDLILHLYKHLKK